MDEYKTCKIRHELKDVGYEDEKTWEKMIDFLLLSSANLEKELKSLVLEIFEKNV